MLSKFLAATSAALVSLTLLAGAPASAQAQLAAEVMDQLAALDLDPTGWVLTEEQVLQIENVLNSTESDDTKVDQIKEIAGAE